MKKEDKRIRNNDFEQVEECKTCKNLFWAKSYLELGNWESDCNACKKNQIHKAKQKKELFIKQGKEIRGIQNQIYGWELNGEQLLNEKYDSALGITYVPNIDDTIREFKKKHKKVLHWFLNEFQNIKAFAYRNGFAISPEVTEFRFMGILHKLK